MLINLMLFQRQASYPVMKVIVCVCTGTDRRSVSLLVLFFLMYAFIILTSILVLGINYFVVMTHPLHPIQVRERSSSS